MADYGPEDVARLFTERHAEAVRELGRFNLAVFGKTGSGKSTLVNAIFGSQVAATGTGAPVTAGVNYHEHPEGILGVYDSQGFEVGQAGDSVLAGLAHIVAESRRQPIERQIHAAWYLVRWSDRRFEAHQAAFVRRLAELVPVVFVLSQVPTSADGRVHGDALALAGFIESIGLPLSPRNHVYLTNALADPFLGSAVFGLRELLDATFETAPEAARRALAAAQLIDRERKRQAARNAINTAAASAMATGVTPIPFSDAAILVPIQITMIARITAAYGLVLPSARLGSMVASLMLSTGATTAGRWVVGSLLRAIPGGQIPAMVISGTVAASLTKAMGWGWAAVCERALGTPGGLAGLDQKSVKQLFADEFRSRMRRGLGGSRPMAGSES